MYNKDLKIKFIKDNIRSESVRKNCETIFKAIQKYEEEWQADICTQSIEKLQPAMDEITGFRVHSKHTRLNILRDYVNWCINIGVPGARRDIFEIDIFSGLDKLKRQTLASPAHLEKYLNEICEPVEEKTSDIVYRCYCWLAFAGIEEDEILKIKRSQVDFSKMAIRYGNTEAPLYREAVPVVKSCIELSHFVYKHPNIPADKTVLKARMPGDTLIRGTKGEYSPRVIRVGLSRRSRQKMAEGRTELQLSYYRIWISGVFYRMYEREQIGIEPDFESIVSKQMEGKTYKTSKSNTLNSKKRQLMREYLEDYERWKIVYKK